MKFRTICITKRKLTVSFIAAISIIVSAIYIAAVTDDFAAVPVFNNGDTPVYSDILEEGLPSEDKGFNIKEIICSIIGFDLEQPESVISEFSVVFENEGETADFSADEIVKEEENTADNIEEAGREEPQQTPENIRAKNADFPSLSEIAQGIGLEINNATSYSVNLKELCAQSLDLAVEKNESPQVLVVHTHTTECFDGDAMNGETERTTNEERNIVAVGNVIAQTLEENGIHCVHDKTVHDYPSYQGAYTRTLSTIDYNLKQYPDIKIVLDVHRDAYIYPDGSKLTVSCEQNGVSTAKVMLVLGTDSLGLSHPNWQKNLALAAKIQSAANIMYPGMMRPINLRRERFNMHTTTGSLLLEVGSNGNTLDEAIEGGRNVANAISAVLGAN